MLIFGAVGTIRICKKERLPLFQKASLRHPVCLGHRVTRLWCVDHRWKQTPPSLALLLFSNMCTFLFYRNPEHKCKCLLDHTIDVEGKQNTAHFRQWRWQKALRADGFVFSQMGGWFYSTVGSDWESWMNVMWREVEEEEEEEEEEGRQTQESPSLAISSSPDRRDSTLERKLEPRFNSHRHGVGYFFFFFCLFFFCSCLFNNLYTTMATKVPLYYAHLRRQDKSGIPKCSQSIL